MLPIFTKIAYYDCVEPLGGALQMALDELLLTDCPEGRVILRIYRWMEPTTSIGYFGNIRDVKKPELSKLLVRRPTGGGLVEHGHGRDFTYSVLIGSAVVRDLKLVPRQSYRAIHSVLGIVLRKFGIEVTLAGDHESADGSQACFANPVGDDLMFGSKKLAGAGQKRSRGAILHQGSVQPVRLPGEFGLAFAKALACEVEKLDLGAAILSAAENLAEMKYRNEDWTKRRKFRR